MRFRLIAETDQLPQLELGGIDLVCESEQGLVDRSVRVRDEQHRAALAVQDGAKRADR